MVRRANFNLTLDSTDRPVSPVYIDSSLKIVSGVLHTRSRWLNQCVILVEDTARIGQLRNCLFVSKVEWVGYFANGLHQRAARVNEKHIPSSERPLASKTSGTAAYYGSAWTATTMVNGDYLHDQGLTGRGKLIAVIDEGFTGVDTQPAFDSMRRSGRLIDTHNFLYDDTNVFVNYYHGTNVLSTMAGFLPGTYVGSAPHAEYALYSTEDASFTDAIYELDNLIAAMERADSVGADIITASIVYNVLISPYNADFTRGELDGSSTNVARAANLAVAKGIVYVSSAGNEGRNSWNFLNSPGDADSVITVGSVNVTRNASGFSSPGPNSSGRVKPDVCLLGEPVSVYDAFGNIDSQDGTSFAAPQLAGYIACLLQGTPKSAPSRIRNAIHRSSDRFTAPTAKLGFGIPDFRNVLPYLNVRSEGIYPQLRIAPNPFTSYITMQLPPGITERGAIGMTDAFGRHIPFKSRISRNGAVVLEMPDELPTGVYFIHVSGYNTQLVGKIVKVE